MIEIAELSAISRRLECPKCGTMNKAGTVCECYGGSDQRLVRPSWRLLNRLDFVQVSDEFLTDDCETWDSCANAARFIVGQKYDPVFFQPMRRREDGTTKLCREAGRRKEMNMPKTNRPALVRLCNAITEALREMQKCPNDSVQDIWNESLESWETGLRMDHNYNVEPNAERSGPAAQDSAT